WTGRGTHGESGRAESYWIRLSGVNYIFRWRLSFLPVFGLHQWSTVGRSDAGGVRSSLEKCNPRSRALRCRGVALGEGCASLSGFRTDAGTQELQYDRVMHDPINGRRGGHRVFEDLVPFREHQVGSNHDAFALVALSEERKEDFHFCPVVLNVSDVIERETLEVVEALELASKPEVSLGIQQSLHEAGHRGEQDRMAVFHQRSTQRRHHMRIAGPGMADQAHVSGAGEE